MKQRKATLQAANRTANQNDTGTKADLARRLAGNNKVKGLIGAGVSVGAIAGIGGLIAYKKKKDNSVKLGSEASELLKKGNSVKLWSEALELLNQLATYPETNITKSMEHFIGQCAHDGGLANERCAFQLKKDIDKMFANNGTKDQKLIKVWDDLKSMYLSYIEKRRTYFSDIQNRRPQALGYII